MVYILDQRLRAQNIPDEKSKKGKFTVQNIGQIWEPEWLLPDLLNFYFTRITMGFNSMLINQNRTLNFINFCEI